MNFLETHHPPKKKDVAFNNGALTIYYFSQYYTLGTQELEVVNVVLVRVTNKQAGSTTTFTSKVLAITPS